MNSEERASNVLIVQRASEYALKIGSLLNHHRLKVDWHHILKHVPNTQTKYKYHVPGAGLITTSPDTLRLIYNALLLCRLIIDRHLSKPVIADYSHSHGHLVFILFELFKSCHISVAYVHTLGDGRDVSYINATVNDWDLLKVRYITVQQPAPDESIYICDASNVATRHKHGITMT